MSFTWNAPSWLTSQGDSASTVTVVDPWIAAKVAVIALVSVFLPVASPSALIVVLLDDHVTETVKFCVLLSE